MPTDEYIDPLQYLNRLERLAFGWFVTRQFATNTDRFAKWVKSSGPQAAARIACGRALNLYAWGIGILAVVFDIAGATGVADIFFVLLGVCFVWGLTCVYSSLKPQREYRRTRDAHDLPS